MQSLSGKIAIVTGAGRGIGRAHALTLAKAGCDVVLCDYNLESWKEFAGETVVAGSVKAEVEALGRRCLALQMDMTKSESAKTLINAAMQEFGRIDILVNNVGGLCGQVSESYASSVSEKDIKATFDRNFFSMVFCCQQAAKYMKEQRSGKIITTSSQGGLHSEVGGVYASYGAAKAAVIMYTKYLAQELAPYQINVNCIAPAYVETARLAAIRYDIDGYREKVKATIPLGRLAMPEEISKVMCFLAGPDSDYITGQCVSVCGGYINF